MRIPVLHDKVPRAAELVRQRDRALMSDGQMRADAALGGARFVKVVAYWR